MRPSFLIVPPPLKLTGKLLFVCLKREWQKSTIVFELQFSLLPLGYIGTKVSYARYDRDSCTSTLLIAFIRDHPDFSSYSTIQKKWSFSCPHLAHLFPGAAISSKLERLICLLPHFYQCCSGKKEPDIAEELNCNSLGKRCKKGKY